MFRVRGTLRRGLRLVTVFGVAAGVVAVLPIATASAVEVTPILTGQSAVVDVAFDAAGDMFLSDYTGQVQVDPATSGTLFGQSVTAGSVTTLATLNNVPGIATHGGALYMTDSSAGTVSVLTSSRQKLYGVEVPADTVTTLASGLSGPIGIAFSGNNLFVATSSGISVLSSSATTIFGQAVAADTMTLLSATTGLPSGNPGPAFLAFDRAGDLFVSDLVGGTVSVLPVASGMLFGQAVTADTLTTIVSGLFEPSGVALDQDGNLYITVPGTVEVLPAATGSIDGQAVTADTLAPFGVAVGGLGLSFYSSHLYLADQILATVDKMSTSTAHIREVIFSGTTSNPKITVVGSGFTAGPSSTGAGCSATGLDYNYGDLYLYDANTAVQMGVPGDCVGLFVSSLTSTRVVFTLGNWYGTSAAVVSPGDSITMTVDGASFTTTATYSGG